MRLRPYPEAGQRPAASAARHARGQAWQQAKADQKGKGKDDKNRVKGKGDRKGW